MPFVNYFLRFAAILLQLFARSPVWDLPVIAVIVSDLQSVVVADRILKLCPGTVRLPAEQRSQYAPSTSNVGKTVLSL